MNLKEIKNILGGDVSSKNSKMPGTSFGLSTDFCNVGGKLRDIEGSVCASCYAARLESFRPSVKKGWTSRAEAVLHATSEVSGPGTLERMSLWTDAMVERLTKLAPTHHRWHDSGDLLNYNHLMMIVWVSDMLPDISFWLPTKEKKLVNRFLNKVGKFPDNLTVRLSAPMVDQIIFSDTIQMSAVITKDRNPCGAWVCPARHQGNSCGDCRACWDPAVRVVAYPKH